MPDTAPPSPEASPPAAVTASSSSHHVIPPPEKIQSDAPTTRHVADSSLLPPLEPAAGTATDDDDVSRLRPRRSRWLLPVVAAAALIAMGVVTLRRVDHAAPPVTIPAARAPQPAADIAPRAASTAAAVPEPSPTGASNEEAPKDNDQPLAKAAPSSEPAAGEVRRIFIKSNPPGARLFWRGKEVGTTPFTLELQPGEKHAYELDLPGHVTRKVVIDGSKSELSIGLRPQSGAFTGASPRK